MEIRRILSKAIILLLVMTLFFSSLIFAGPNENAGIRFDLNATTYGNQNDTTMAAPPVGDYIRVDVYAINVHNLDTYEFEVNYNPSQLDYITASATNPITYEPNILTTNGGTALGWMIDTSNPGVLSIAYTLAGTDTLEAPEGEGLIADIVFQTLTINQGFLTFGDVHFHDSFGVMDIITDKGIAILFDENGDVDGTVTDYNTGEPIEGAIVSIESTSDTTGFDGTYLLENILIGIHNITCTADGYYDSSDVVEVLEDQTVTYDFVLESIPYGTLNGTVTDANTNEPIEDALITATSQGRVEYTCSTNAYGYYIIDSLLASELVGNYTVTCDAGNSYLLGEETDVEIVEGDTTTVDFVLEPIPYGTLNGTVTDSTTCAPIEDALITATSQGRVEYIGSTNADGYYIIDSLLASELVGNYTVTCDAGDAYPLGEETDVVIIEGDTTTVDFVLAPLINMDIGYDDRLWDEWVSADVKYYVKFTQYYEVPYKVKKINIATYFQHDLEAVVFPDNGSGLPDTTNALLTANYSYYGDKDRQYYGIKWVGFTVNGNGIIDTPGDIWLEFKFPPDIEYKRLCVDTNSVSGMSYYYEGDYHPYTDGNYMMHIVVEDIALEYDVLIKEIDIPHRYTVPADNFIIPRIFVENAGQDMETFDVTCCIDSIGSNVYTSSVPVTIVPASTVPVTFEPWLVGGENSIYNISFYSQLGEDMYPSNDTLDVTVIASLSDTIRYDLNMACVAVCGNWDANLIVRVTPQSYPCQLMEVMPCFWGAQATWIQVMVMEDANPDNLDIFEPGDVIWSGYRQTTTGTGYQHFDLSEENIIIYEPDFEFYVCIVSPGFYMWYCMGNEYGDYNPANRYNNLSQPLPVYGNYLIPVSVQYSPPLPEIVVYPTSFDVEIPVDTTFITYMTINNPGTGPLDFIISIPVDRTFRKDDKDYSKLDGNFSKVLTGKTFSNPQLSPSKSGRGSNFRKDSYSEFEVSPVSEAPVSITQPSASCLPAIPITSGLWKAGRTYRPAGEDTLHYDYCYTGAMGIGEAGTWEGAIRLTPEELSPYNGWNLTSVLFYYYTGDDTGRVKIYGAGTPSSPGILITSEPYSVSDHNWWRIDLSSPVGINPSQDMWVSVQVSQPGAGVYPIGTDDGPAIEGKGDWIYYAGAWSELLDYGFSYNWNIRAIVAPPGCEWLSVTPVIGTVPPGQSLDINVQFDTYGLTPDSTYTTTIFIYNNSAESPVIIPVTLYVTTVGVDDETPEVPGVFSLGQNYPNPLDPQTTISYTLPKSCKVSLSIYNIKGQLVETLVDEVQQPGYHSVVWNVEDASSGIYFYRITAGDFTDTKKCVILK